MTNWYLTAGYCNGAPLLMVDGVAHAPDDVVEFPADLFGEQRTAADHVRDMLSLRGTRGAAYDADLNQRLPEDMAATFLS